MKTRSHVMAFAAACLGLGLLAASTAPATANAAPIKVNATQTNLEPAPAPIPLACGKTGAKCMGNGDCCSGWDCKDLGSKGRSCQPS